MRFSRLRNRFWALKSGKHATVKDLMACAPEVRAKNYPDRMTQLFYENEGPTAHKWLHYLPIYQSMFGRFVGTKVRFLEIGVFRGGSLKLWRDFLGSDAVIFGVDINPDCASHNGNHGQVRIGSQTDKKFLANVVAEMGGVDVVLDDGSHLGVHQQSSFEALFKLLSNNGIYMIEDLLTAYWPEFEGGLRRRGTGIEFLKDLVDRMHTQYYTNPSTLSFEAQYIESVQFFDSLAVVHKKLQPKKEHVMVLFDQSTVY